MKFLTLIFFYFTFFSLLINAQEPLKEKIAKRIYTTKRLQKVPVIDGDISDDAWSVVSWSSDFTEKNPDEGTPPAYQTKFKIIYDAKYLYIAIRAFDEEPNLIQKRLSRRDGFAGDRVNVIIDSYHDKRTAFVFTTTAAGVKGEEIVTQNGNNWDESWNPIWYTDAKVDDKGWTTEMKIPFSQLRFGDAKEQIWGFNINRTIFRLQERSLWQRIPNDQSGFISEAGELHGLIDLVPQKQLEIQPFTVLQYDNYPVETGNPYRDGSDFKINAGLDAKIGITNDLTLDLTINPDFGQVEADPAAIALDGFQVFFEEQRPFFVENKNIFDFRFSGQDNIFYSRRIGRSPQGSLDLEDHEYNNIPINTTILGAAKFSGKTQNGWSLGVLESITANEYAEIDDNGERREVLVEPLTNYFVARAQKDFNDRNTFFGGVFTATNRNLNNNLADELHKSAYTAGIDFEHNWHNRDYYLKTHFVLSRVNGSEEVIQATQESLTHLFQRTDASHVSVDPTKTSLTGTGGRVFGGKRAGNWQYFAGFNWRSPELELNDIGFLRQADLINQFARISYNWLKPTNLIRDANLRLNQNSSYDFEGNYNRIQYELQGYATWKNNWWTEFSLGHKPRIFSNTFLQGGPRWRFSEENFITLFLGSDNSKKFNFTFGQVYSSAKQDNFSFWRSVLRFNYQPLNALSISLSTAFENNPNKTQYVTAVDYEGITRYILAGIDNQNLSTTLRLNYSINPNLSLQFYGQPYIARVRYNNYNYVSNATSKDLNERVTWYNDAISESNNVYYVDENSDGATDYTFNKPDFSYVQFRSNLVARWEYIPGSELFFVWSRGVTAFDETENSLTQGLNNQITGSNLEDTFLIKATYRFIK
ncbi:DUF5916 domain-containing protein [uncultured Polaribacter sp.]|uniref:DUF5916 domain-containing protein n=1 Tax=uncultured Polaribacter sp. TaxID=174711 RepID=UPI002633A1FA|nr:DUF5916 domain-containing protein [uncultured Polaribacter sp.]